MHIFDGFFCTSNISQEIKWFNTWQQFVGKLFDCVWPFSGFDTRRVNSIKPFMTYINFRTLTLRHNLICSTSYSWWWFTRPLTTLPKIFLVRTATKQIILKSSWKFFLVTKLKNLSRYYVKFGVLIYKSPTLLWKIVKLDNIN